MRIKHFVYFNFTATNNEAEHEAFLAEARMATVLEANVVKIHTDSQ